MDSYSADDPPRISVAVLNYNGFEHLRETVPELMSFDYPNYEIIVVDNDSTDGSLKYLREMKEKSGDTVLKLIENNKNVGYSAGKNDCVAAAEGEYVLLLDEDIRIDNDHILRGLLRTYREKPDIGFLSLALVDKGEEKTSFYGGYYSLYGFAQNDPIKKEAIKKSDLIRIGYPHGGGIFFSRDIWNNVGGYDESQPYYLDDSDIGARASLLGYKSYLYTDYIAVHLGVESQSDLNYWIWKYKYFFSGRFRIMAKNYRAINFCKSLPVIFLLTFAKTTKQTVQRKDIRIVKAFLFSVLTVVRRVPDTLRRRQDIQSQRIVRKDDFLSIRPPEAFREAND